MRNSISVSIQGPCAEQDMSTGPRFSTKTHFCENGKDTFLISTLSGQRFNYLFYYLFLGSVVKVIDMD